MGAVLGGTWRGPGGSWGALGGDLVFVKNGSWEKHETRLVNGLPGAPRGDPIDVLKGFVFFFLKMHYKY